MRCQHLDGLLEQRPRALALNCMECRSWPVPYNTVDGNIVYTRRSPAFPEGNKPRLRAAVQMDFLSRSSAVPEYGRAGRGSD